MTRNRSLQFLSAGMLLLTVLAGCGGKQDSSSASGTASGPAASPDQAVQNHLNDPNVPEAQKAEIRKHMQPGGAGTPAAKP